MSFFEELKRRNVIRVAGLYVVGSWLIVQVATIVLPMFDSIAWLPRLSPGDISAHYRLCEALLAKGEAKAALNEVQQEPHEAWRLTGLAMAHHSLKQEKDSDAALAELIKKFGTSWPYNVAYVYAWRGERDLAFNYLDIAHTEQDPDLTAVAVEPFFDSIHQDSRWLPM